MTEEIQMTKEEGHEFLTALYVWELIRYSGHSGMLPDETVKWALKRIPPSGDEETKERLRLKIKAAWLAVFGVPPLTVAEQLERRAKLIEQAVGHRPVNDVNPEGDPAA